MRMLEMDNKDQILATMLKIIDRYESMSMTADVMVWSAIRAAITEKLEDKKA